MFESPAAVATGSLNADTSVASVTESQSIQTASRSLPDNIHFCGDRSRLDELVFTDELDPAHIKRLKADLWRYHDVLDYDAFEQLLWRVVPDTALIPPVVLGPPGPDLRGVLMMTILLRNGGIVFVPHDGTTGPFSIHLIEGRVSRCHDNAIALSKRKSHKYEMFFGFALSEDRLWRCHSWCMDMTRARIVETTTPRLVYVGVPFSILDDVIKEEIQTNTGHNTEAETEAKAGTEFVNDNPSDHLK